MENRQNKPPEGGAASGHGGQKFHTDSEQAKLHKSKLRMESREERLNKARERLAKQKPPKKPGPIKRIARIAGHETHAFLHGKVYQEERDNVGVEGGHFVERSGEAALHYGRHKVRRAIREHPAKAAARAESRYIKATADYHSRKFAQEQPEAQSAAARLWHRHKLKREYQRKARETAKQTAKAAEQTVSATERFVREAAAFVKRHPVGTLLALGCLLVVLTLQSCMSSMVSVGNSTLAAIAASTYKAEDADMLGAEAAYCALEDELQRCLDTYTRTHDYDEYHFDLDTIEHDPYVLISMISALHEGAWALDEVRGTLQDLFDRQYILTEDVVVEVRYRTVTRTDSEGNNYDVEVPYNYYICYVTLENFNLSHVPVHQGHGGLPFPQVCTGAAGGAERRRPVMAPPQAETGVSAQGAGNRQADRQSRRTNRIGHRAVCPGSGGVRQAASRGDAACAGLPAGGADPAIVYVLDGVRGKQHPCGHRRQHL